MGEMLQLRVWLVDSEPEIWRRLVVDPRLTLEQLHKVVQAAFGWEDYHMHQFHERMVRGRPAGVCFATPYDRDLDLVDERRVLVGDVLDVAHKRLVYEYDFGDSWLHIVKRESCVDSETVEYPFETFIVEGRGVFSGKARAAMCVGGERNGPPEDAGGIWRYSQMLEWKQNPALANTDEKRELLEWLGDWEAARVDLSEINARLGRIRVKKALR